jgi:hypothetical protein
VTEIHLTDTDALCTGPVHTVASGSEPRAWHVDHCDTCGRDLLRQAPIVINIKLPRLGDWR